MLSPRIIRHKIVSSWAKELKFVLGGVVKKTDGFAFEDINRFLQLKQH